MNLLAYGFRKLRQRGINSKRNPTRERGKEKGEWVKEKGQRGKGKGEEDSYFEPNRIG